jgi:hypothetical protein
MEPASATLLGRRLAAAVMLLAIAAGIGWFLSLHPWESPAVVLLAALPHLPLAAWLWPGIWRRRAERLPAAVTDLERRRRVWGVLSELYLDTELTARDHERIAAELADCGYRAGQLEEILYRELHPVLLGNLLSVAGEWAGFDPEWLEAQILGRAPRRSSLAVIPGKWLVHRGWTAIAGRLRRTTS